MEKNDKLLGKSLQKKEVTKLLEKEWDGAYPIAELELQGEYEVQMVKTSLVKRLAILREKPYIKVINQYDGINIDKKGKSWGNFKIIYNDIDTLFQYTTRFGFWERFISDRLRKIIEGLYIGKFYYMGVFCAWFYLAKITDKEIVKERYEI